MENIEMKRDGNILTIKIDLTHRGEKSSTGKTIRVASTEGNIEVPGSKDIKIGINAYTK